MYYWPVTSFVLYVSTLMWFFCGITLLIVCRLLGFTVPFSLFGDDDDDEGEDEEAGVDVEPGALDGQAAGRVDEAGDVRDRPRAAGNTACVMHFYIMYVNEQRARGCHACNIMIPNIN